MELKAVQAGTVKLDGGAMFGVVPRALWTKRIEADASGRCTWATRCLVIREGDRQILIDTGLGDKQDEKFFSHFSPQGPGIEAALRAEGIAPEEITDVLLTHLHFDHCGGAVKREGEKLIPTFKHAQYWSEKSHWDWAMSPNPREKGSFLQENFVPLQESGQLNFIADGQELIPGVSVKAFFGHTEAMLVPHIRYKDRTLVYLADLQPSIHHFPLAWVMAYDVRPLETMKERAAFLEHALAENYLFMFEHDAENECCSLKAGRRGVEAEEVFKLSEWS